MSTILTIIIAIVVIVIVINIIRAIFEKIAEHIFEIACTFVVLLLIGCFIGRDEHYILNIVIGIIGLIIGSVSFLICISNMLYNRKIDKQIAADEYLYSFIYANEIDRCPYDELKEKVHGDIQAYQSARLLIDCPLCGRPKKKSDVIEFYIKKASIQVCADYLMVKIQELSAVSDKEADIFCNEDDYIMQFRRKNEDIVSKALLLLEKDNKVIKEKMKENEYLYINATPIGEQMQVIEIEMD